MSIHTYLQTVTAVAIFCTVIRNLTDKTAQSSVISMFCGICMLGVVLIPLKTGVDELSRIKQQLCLLHGASTEVTSPAISANELLTQEYAAEAANSYLETHFSAMTGQNCIVHITVNDDLYPVSANLEAPAAYRDTLFRLCKDTLGLDEDALEFTAIERKEVP